MTELLFTNVRLLDPDDGPGDGPGWLAVAGGEIRGLGHGEDRSRALRTIDGAGRILAPGLIDTRVFVGEPGATHRESFRSAGRAAAAGGITTIVAQPDTTPPLDDPALLAFALARGAERAGVRVHAMAALTRGLGGREMTEQGLLLAAGATAFTDADRTVADAKTLMSAMRYATGTGALVVHHPDEPALSSGTVATSGAFATKLGLPARPAIAERMGLERDLALVEETGCRYHADILSTEGALAALRQGRERGLDVTAGTTIHHLALNGFDIGDYRTFFKVEPPLRAEDDRRATVDALAKGLIDVVTSGHAPWGEEDKRQPFEAAATGAVGLETMLPVLMRLHHTDGLSLARLWQAASAAPARRFGLPGGRLTAGAPADLVLFDPNAPFVLDRHALRSKSRNTPFDGARLQGRVLGTWVGGARVFGEEGR